MCPCPCLSPLYFICINFSGVAYVSQRECSHGDDDEDYMQVDGKLYRVDDISEDLVAQMTTNERETYAERFRHLWC